jgi:hypothetical protein
MPSLPLIPKISVIVVPLLCSETLPCSDSLACSENTNQLSFVVPSTLASFTVRLSTSTVRSTDTLRAPPSTAAGGLTLVPRSPGSLPLTPN